MILRAQFGSAHAFGMLVSIRYVTCDSFFLALLIKTRSYTLTLFFYLLATSLVFAGTAGIASYARAAKYNLPLGSDVLMTCIVQGAAVTFAIYIAGGITGGFLNPAVTVVWSVLGRLKWKNCLAYCIAQYLGAFCASAVNFLTFYDLFMAAKRSGSVQYQTALLQLVNVLNNTMDVTSGASDLSVNDPSTRFSYSDYKGAFGTYPREGISMANAGLDQIICSMMLLIGVLAVSDRRNWRPPDGLFPIIVGLMVMTVNLGFNYNTGSAMNPARDFSPRLFSYLIGMGPGTFDKMDYMWFAIPIIASHLGALVGAIVYTTFIEVHWPQTPTAAICITQSEISESSAVLTANKTVMPDCYESYPHPVYLLEERVPGRVDHTHT